MMRRTSRFVSALICCQAISQTMRCPALPQASAGIAATTEQVIQLDRLGLQDGEEYTVRLFYAQRAAGESQFNLRTNIELWCDEIVTVTYAGD